MGISRIHIKNYKSIKNVTFYLKRDEYVLQCLIGKNGAGKSNFLDAINYFYLMLSDTTTNVEKVIDSSNIYLQSTEIEMEYDFSDIEKKNSNPYYDQKIMELNPYIKNNKLRIQMVQYKNNQINWYPEGISKESRKFLYKLFPVCFIDTRFISLQDWTCLWDIIADISISKLKIDNEDVSKKFDELLNEMYGEKYTKTITEIINIFSNEGIAIDDRDYREKYKNSLAVRLGGRNFLSEDNRLSFYSDGLNSLKYIKLYYELIVKLSNTGWKNPLVIIDEPEIGLHTEYIGELVKCFEKNNSKGVNTIISTHSPQLVSRLIKNEIPIGIWQIYNDNLYSHFAKLKDLVETNQKYLISDTEAACYFSKVLLFVEGKSEVQLFKDKRILELFPKMEKINVVRYDSDNSVLKIIYPDEMGFNIPYLTVIDMDKIMSYSYKTQKFKVKCDSLVNPLYNEKIIKKQKYMFYKSKEKISSRKKRTYYQRLKINKMLKGNKYIQNERLFFINNDFFEKLIQEIKQYCMEYNIYPMKTTIEGGIVNDRTVEFVIEWLKKILSSSTIQNLDDILKDRDINNKKYRTTVIRLILNGKLDILLNYNEKNTKIDSGIKNKITSINGKIGGKTGGWIREFLEYYFSNYIDVLDSVEARRDKFKEDFEEISFVLLKCENMVE